MGTWTGGDIEVSIPKSIRIGGRWYELRLEPHLIVDTENRGECYNRDGIIKVEPRIQPELRIITLIHELLHAIGAVYMGNELFLHDPELESLSNGLYQVLTDLGIRFKWEL